MPAAAADLYAQLCTWDAGDISRDPRYGGDLAQALSAITARLLLMPGETDLYFRVADNAAELPHLRDAILRRSEHLGPPRRQSLNQSGRCGLSPRYRARVPRSVWRDMSASLRIPREKTFGMLLAAQHRHKPV